MNIKLICFNVFILGLLAFYAQTFLLSEGAYYQSLGSQLSVEQIEELLKSQQKWQWLGYLILPVIYLTKILFISAAVYIIKMIVGKSFKAKFSDISLAVIKADMIFLIPALIKITWFTFFPARTLEEIQYFMPGSVFQLFADQEIVPWLVYPLQAFSVWEVGFWLILAFELKEFFDNDFGRSFQNVMLSYGSGFLVWIVFVVFLTINFT